MGTNAPLLGEPLPVELMNTIWADRNGGYDALSTPAETTGWLQATGHDVTQAPADLALQLRELRDALRQLAADATDDPRPRTSNVDALAVVNRACALAPSWSSLNTDGSVVRICARTTTEQAISKIAEQAVSLFSGDHRSRLRACLAPGCVLFFVRQHPRREWCSASCGNRARVARHYDRHH
ncbi:CGNR zinc finger domain-containing protein [Fodinicola feengrottensis]|uniref:CGNR zinc finger domain-containing protein n=1 Tax=Fodinicola feengrottensis TaxID=435914 RepID=A0ABN2G3D0_9ACTN